MFSPKLPFVSFTFSLSASHLLAAHFLPSPIFSFLHLVQTCFNRQFSLLLSFRFVAGILRAAVQWWLVPILQFQRINYIVHSAIKWLDVTVFGNLNYDVIERHICILYMLRLILLFMINSDFLFLFYFERGVYNRQSITSKLSECFFFVREKETKKPKEKFKTERKRDECNLFNIVLLILRR